MKKQNEPDREDLRDRPVIEITEEMIDAGIKAYLLWRDGSDWQCETLVKAVHLAMLENRPQSPQCS